MIALWLRASARRPRRAVSTVLVLAVLTVATAAALVGGDALARLFRDDALAEWGAVDVEARSARGPFLPDGAARMLTVKAGPAVVAGAPRLLLRAVAEHDGRRDAQATVLGLGAEEADFAPRASVGSLAAGEALLNARLAGRLHAAVGDTVDLVVAVPEWQERIAGRDAPLLHPAKALPLRLRVAGVVPDTGVADLHRSGNLLVRREVLQDAAGLSPAQSTALHLDVRADGRDAAEDVIDAVAPDAARLGVVLAPVKADALDTADEEGGLFRSILLSLAALVLLASVAATVELLTALGLDRSLELALLRTAGMRRRLAARLLVGEGVLYAVVGVVLGLVLAVPAGNALAAALADHFAGIEDTRGREQVALSTDFGPTPLVVGALVVLLTAALAARSSARRVLAGDLDDVLRGTPASGSAPTGPARPVALLATGTFLLGAGASGSGPLVYLGLTLVLAAAWLRARRRSASRRRTDERCALLALVWSLGGAALLGDFGSGVQAGFGVLTVAGIVAVASTSFLLAARLRAAGRLVRGWLPAGRPQVTWLVGASWAEQARDRSALRMCSVGGALFTAAALTVLGSAQSLPVDRQSGGFDAIGTSVVGVDARAGAAALGGEAVAVPHAVVPERAYRTQHGDDGPLRGVVYPVKLAAVTTELVQAQRFGLADALPEYRTAGDALSAVLREEDKAVVDRYALPEGARVGDDVVLKLRGIERRLTLVAVLDTYLLDAVFVGGRPFDELAARSGGTFVLVRGSSAAEWNSRERAAGLDLRPVGELRDEVVRVNRTFTDVFAVMLLLGLVVVVVSIAASTVRAAHQRRPEMAVLRALGCRRRTVVAALVAEPFLGAFLGALLGLGAGLAVLRGLFALGYSSLAFVLDWPRLAGAVGATLALVLVTGVLAAARAARRDPAEDLAALG